MPVDQIWHAGDVGNIQILNELQKLKPVVAVSGNIDGTDVRAVAPKVQLFRVEQVGVLMMHIGGYPGKYEAEARKLIETKHPKIFVSGHSHILRVMFDKRYNCLHLNPGAAGQYGFHKVRTMLRFTIDGINIRDLEVWEYKKHIGAE